MATAAYCWAKICGHTLEEEAIDVIRQDVQVIVMMLIGQPGQRLVLLMFWSMMSLTLCHYVCRLLSHNPSSFMA